MGDKGGKKDKNKLHKQKIKKHEQEAKRSWISNNPKTYNRSQNSNARST